ncbi:MAG: sulfite exporter TauE/SafE family protein [Gemmatimonadota bacterium]
MNTLLLVAALGSFAGLVMGLLGGGGALVTVPVLVYVLGYDASEAVIGGLIVVALSSSVATVSHWRAGNLELRRAVPFAVAAAVAAYLSARLGAHLPGNLRMLIFAAVVLAAAVVMMRPAAEPSARPVARSRGVLPAAGAGVGLLTGLVGVGGGFLTVPVLSTAGGLPMRSAIGTSALIIGLNSLTGLFGFLGETSLARRDIFWFAAPAAMAALLGTRLMPRIPVTVLRRLFVLLLVAVESVVVYETIVRS